MSDILVIVFLFGSSFLSATLLPGNSEILLVILLAAGSVSPVILVLSATTGNVIGGLTNVIIGRWLPGFNNPTGLDMALRWLQKFGPAALLLSWLPVIGDLLCVLAGWLRMPLASVVVFLFLGKALRYILITMMASQEMALWY